MKKINNKIRYSLNDLLVFEDSQFNSYINREIELGNIEYIEPNTNITKPLRYEEFNIEDYFSYYTVR